MEPRSWQDPPEYGGGGMQLAMPGMTPAVKLLLILNVGIFLFDFVVLGFMPNVQAGFHELCALSPALWRAWFPFVPVWQLLTYGFLHGGVTHILYNMLFLYFLGTMLEGVIGTRRFWTLYLVSVVVAGFVQLMFGMITVPAPILGASGGVLAVVCALATLQPMTRIIFILFPITLRTLAIFAVAMDALRIVMELQGGGGSGVASFAHLTGAAIGYGAVKTGLIWRDPLASLARAREQRAAEGEADARLKLDELLAKINREGIGSLSARERAFLKRMSKR